MSYTNETLHSVKKKKKKKVLIIEMDLRMILMGKFRLVFSILDFAGSKKIVIYVCLFSKQVKLKPNYRHIY